MKSLAKYWKHIKGDSLKIRCELCPHNCLILEGKNGLCNVRKNIKGELITINYGQITSLGLDPIEKKPLYHFYPGKNILSVGTYGCNMRCLFCQNYRISQEKPPSKYLKGGDLLQYIYQANDNIGIAFTYNEPLMWYEYIFDVFQLIKEHDKSIKTVLVTNGYINSKPLNDLLPFIDAMNIDLKTYSNTTYQRLCGAQLSPVLETIKQASEKCHVEVTTLIITNENDSMEEIAEIAKFLGSINKNIVLHLSRYYPTYKLDHPQTSLSTLYQAREIALKYLNNVYLGNIIDADANTYCPNCKYKIISRNNYQTKVFVEEPICPNCKEKIALIM